MVEEEQVKAPEATGRAPIQIQTGDVEVAKLQLAARWAEFSSKNADLADLLTAFNTAFKAIDETLRM